MIILQFFIHQINNFIGDLQVQLPSSDFICQSAITALAENQLFQSFLTQSNSIRCGLSVDPEGHPGEDDQEGAWNVNLNEEEAGVTLEMELRGED